MGEPKDKRAEKAYCITLSSYMKLKDDRMGTFQDLALSDYTLQDAIYVVDGEPDGKRSICWEDRN